MNPLSNDEYLLIHSALGMIAKGLELARSGILSLDKYLECKQKGISYGPKEIAGNHQTKSSEHFEMPS